VTGVWRLHTVADYHQLRAAAELGRRFAVLGGGFIGTELTAALTGVGVEVTMLFPETGIGARLFPDDLSRALNSMIEQQGVDVRPRTELDGVEAVGDQLALSYRDRRERSDRTVFVDGIVAGIGVRPQVALAREAGLEVDDGIVVDETFRTRDPDIYAAGDIASYPCPVLGRRRVEHEDHANASGLAAGRAMAGEPEPYDHLPFLYSDFFDLSYEAIGDLDPSLDTISDWWAPYREGVVYYLREGRIRGILLWGVRGQLDPARRLLRDPGPFTRDDLIGRLPESP
jgi:NADPH-dependent 2,4-dienoyl-CoA reductase/sulfur reductase-like enzyme